MSYAVLIGTGLLITCVVPRTPRRSIALNRDMSKVCPFTAPFRHGRRSTMTTPRATTIRPSLAAARRYKNETTR
jgi:hypothetical protein